MKRVVQTLPDANTDPSHVRHRATIRAATVAAGSDDEAEIDRHRDLVLTAVAEIDSAKDSIDAQLASARRNAAATGNYTDRDWYQSRERAARSHGRLRQEAQTALGKLSRRLKEIHTRAQAQTSEGEIDLRRVRELWRLLGQALGELQGEDTP